MIIKISHETYINTDRYAVLCLSNEHSDNFEYSTHCGMSFLGYTNANDKQPSIHVDIYGPTLKNDGSDVMRKQFEDALDCDESYFDAYYIAEDLHKENMSEY